MTQNQNNSDPLLFPLLILDEIETEEEQEEEYPVSYKEDVETGAGCMVALIIIFVILCCISSSVAIFGG